MTDDQYLSAPELRDKHGVPLSRIHAWHHRRRIDGVRYVARMPLFPVARVLELQRDAVAHPRSVKDRR